MTKNFQPYLASNHSIDWRNPAVTGLARALASGQADDMAITRVCFEWVRDEIKHSWDHRLNPLTFRASDVLKHGTGFCYAKSHLLAALLRATGIPAALCYQRMLLPGTQPRYCLHGLNAVFLTKFGWYRIDPRGNKEGMDSQFTPPLEHLPRKADGVQTIDVPGLFAAPLPVLAEVFSTCKTVEDAFENLPDFPVAGERQLQ